MMVMTMMNDKEESDPCPSYLLLPSYITLSLQEFYGRYSPCSRFALIGSVASRGVRINLELEGAGVGGFYTSRGVVRYTETARLPIAF